MALIVMSLIDLEGHFSCLKLLHLRKYIEY